MAEASPEHGLGYNNSAYEDPEPMAPEPLSAGRDEDEEEDYMSMAIVEPTKPLAKETYSQRRARKQREAEDRAYRPSKKALEEAERLARADGLATALPETSRGFRMLAKLGFEPGKGLGRQADTPAEPPALTDANGAPPPPSGPRLEPLTLETKADRGGIGLDDERKRKFRAAAGPDLESAAAKRARLQESATDYRDRVGRERETQRLEKLVGAAMRTVERMDEPPTESERVGKDLTEADSFSAVTASTASNRTQQKRLLDVNVLYRALERDRRTEERERRMREDLMASLPSRRAYHGDPEEDDQDRLALGTEVEDLDEVEGGDEELEAFEALEPEEKLGKLVAYLREKHWYCFWCKSGYENAEMNGCPGETEEDHD